MNLSNHPVTKELRKQLRRDETPSERILWNYLRGKQVMGYRFRQQHGYGPYILDFYCPKLRLCVELDGNVHALPSVRQHDEERTAFLVQNKINVVRFSNDDVENHIDTVLKRLNEIIININNGVKNVCSDPQPPSLGSAAWLVQELRGLK